MSAEAKATPVYWRRRVEEMLIHPAVSVGLVAAGLILFLMGEAVIGPLRTRVEEEKRRITERSQQIQALQNRTTRAERMDVELQTAGLRQQMVAEIPGLRVIMKEMEKFFKKAGWGGRLTPSRVEIFNKGLPEVQAVQLKIEAHTPRRYAERVEDGAEGRLVKLMEKIDSLEPPHLVTRMEVGLGEGDRDLQVLVEVLFFHMEKKP